MTTGQLPVVRNGVRLAWLIVGALGIAGYALIVAPGERHLAATEFHAHELYELANRNERMLQDRDRLVAARNRVERDIRTLTGRDNEGRISLAALRLLDAETQAHHVIVSGFAPETSDSPDSGRIEDESIELRGAYRDVIAAVADLSRHDVLLEVDEAKIVGGSAKFAGNATVDATVQARLYYSIGAAMKEKGDGVP